VTRLLPATALTLVAAFGAAAQDVIVTLPPEAENLRAAVEPASQTLRLATNGLQTPPPDLIAAARADYQTILQSLYAAGHYGPTISIRIDGREAASLGPLDAPESIDTIAITIDPGPRFTFGTIALGPLAPATTLPGAFRPGQVAAADTIAAAVGAGIDAWRATGHAKAEPGAQSITARHADAILDVDITLIPGPRLTFGTITVSGNQNVRTDRVLAIAGLRSGLQYSPQLLDDAQRRLRRSGTFATVAITEADLPGPGDTLDIDILAVEMPPRRLGFGLEISTLDGVGANAFWLHRNLFGGAETFRAELKVIGLEGRSAGPDADLTLSFTRPATRNPDTDLTAEFSAFHVDEPDFLFQGFGAELGFIRYARPDLTFTGGLGAVYALADTPFGDDEYFLLTLPLSARLDRRDDPLNARSGYFIDIAATPFLGLQNSDTGARLYGEARYYLTFADRVTLAARAQAGSVVAASIEGTPSDYLFYSGGTDTVRGQPFNSLGADITLIDSDGTTTQADYGGRSFLGAQLEARFGVTDSIDAVAFVDAGVIGVNQLPDENSGWHAGIGIGARYNTAIGPIRLDIATPLGHGDSFGSVEFYFGIGQSF
jgi:translocation and assembly module TamA